MREPVRCYNWFKGKFKILCPKSLIGITEINVWIRKCFCFVLFFEQEEVNCSFTKQNDLHVYRLNLFLLLSFSYNYRVVNRSKAIQWKTEINWEGARQDTQHLICLFKIFPHFFLQKKVGKISRETPLGTSSTSTWPLTRMNIETNGEREKLKVFSEDKKKSVCWLIGCGKCKTED